MGMVCELELRKKVCWIDGKIELGGNWIEVWVVLFELIQVVEIAFREK